MSTAAKEDTLESANFPGKIGRRLTTALSCFLFGVLVVGGFSLYLATAITVSTNKVKSVAKEIESIERVHYTMHHLVAQLSRALVSGTMSEADKVLPMITALEVEIKQYNKMEAEGHFGEGVSEQAILLVLTEEISLLTRLVDKIRRLIPGGIKPDRGDLDSIHRLDEKIREQFGELSRMHNDKIARELRRSQTNMNIIIGVYLTILVVGVLALAAWSWVVSKTIVSPIRHLASAALEVASGNFGKRVPVISKDEIGQLSQSFNFMAGKICDHEERLKGFATLQERERIAQELHDNLAQDLALLHLKIVEADHAITANGVLRGMEALKEIRKIADGAYEDVRGAIFGLRATVSKSPGLIPTLTEYVRDFSELRKIPVDLRIDEADSIGFSPQVEIQLIRIIHEALTNVFRHAEAKRTVIRFVRDGEFGRVIIEDDGKGFLAEGMEGKGLHFGLQTMRERAEGVGGRLTIDTAPGKGTSVIVNLPFEKRSYETRSSAPGR